MKGDPFQIFFAEDHTPYAAHKPIPVSHHWKEDVKRKLNADVALGIIEAVPQGTPTKWSSYGCRTETLYSREEELGTRCCFQDSSTITNNDTIRTIRNGGHRITFIADKLTIHTARIKKRTLNTPCSLTSLPPDSQRNILLNTCISTY